MPKPPKRDKNSPAPESLGVIINRLFRELPAETRAYIRGGLPKR